MQIIFDAGFWTTQTFIFYQHFPCFTEISPPPLFRSILWYDRSTAWDYAAHLSAQRLVTFDLDSAIVTLYFNVVEWINEEFLPENRSRLKAAHSFLKGELQSMDIPFLDRPAALYIWADLRKVTTPALHKDPRAVSSTWNADNSVI